MFGWLTRLFRPQLAAAPAARVAAPAPVPAPAAAPALKFSGQQLPLVGRSGKVAGFELRLAAATERRLAAAATPAVAGAHYAALLRAAHTLQAAGRSSFVQLPLSALVYAGGVAQVPPGLLLLPRLARADATLAAELLPPLRAAGVRIGAPDGPPSAQVEADFICLRSTGAGDVDTLLRSLQRWQELRRGLKFVALGLDSLEDIERVIAAGVTLAGGRLQSRADQRVGKPLQPAAHRICAMLNELMLDRDTASVARAVRADVTLSYRLLRYANSPAIGLSRGLDTVEQAIIVLGRAELTRWLSVLLMSSSSGRQASGALQEHALARARLLELVARRQRMAGAEVAFTVGMMSRLDELLEVPLAAALQPLRLPDDVSAALLRRAGRWAPYVALAEGIESDDETAFVQLCDGFGGLDAVLEDAKQAWDWAAQVQAVTQ